jgi:chloride channel 7
VTVAVPPGGANGSYAHPASNGSHLGDPEGEADGGALRSELSGWASFGGLGGAAAASGGGGWRAALGKLFSRGATTEAAGVNHTYTSEERARLKQFQSIDYLAPSSRVYRQWLAAQPWGRYWDRWVMMAVSGVAVGLVGFSLHFLIHVLSFTKYHGTR